VQRKPRRHDGNHLDRIRVMPCLVCGSDTGCEAAHVRYSDLSIAKPMSGFGMKPHDWFVVPLCSEHHRQQTNYGNEREWWKLANIDPVKVALMLYVEGADFERAEQIVRSARMAA